MGKRKKSYNPFKMWGSYVGAIISFLAIFLSIPQEIFGRIGLNQILVIPMVETGKFVWKNIPTFIIGAILTIILGFLIGWGIHSLIRRLKK